MRNIIPILLLVLLQGCSMHSRNRDDHHGLPVYDGVSAAYPGVSYALASAAAEELARRYTPAQTTLGVGTDATDFNRDLRAALRALDFSVVPSGSLQVGYTLDLIKDQVPPTCYLQVRTSEGEAFGIVRELSAYSAPAALESPPTPSSSETRPLESKTLPDEPAAASPPASPGVPTEATDIPVPVSPRAVSTPAEQKSTHATPMATVRVKSSASRYAKSKRIAVADFCRWNQVRPETVLEPGRKVFVQSPDPALSTVAPQETNRDRPSKPLVESNSRGQSPAGALAPAAPVALSVPPKPADPVPAATPAGSAPSGPSPVQDALAELSGSKVEEPKTAVPEEPDPWRISPGSLHGQIQGWAIRANYRVIWRASCDLEMQSTASFNGSFVDAIRQLFSSLHRSGFPLRVTVFKGNKVLEVAED